MSLKYLLTLTMALPLLPANLIRARFQVKIGHLLFMYFFNGQFVIRGKFLHDIALFNVLERTAFKRFFNFVDRIWLHVVGPERLSIFSRSRRTNNATQLMGGCKQNFCMFISK